MVLGISLSVFILILLPHTGGLGDEVTQGFGFNPWLEPGMKCDPFRKKRESAHVKARARAHFRKKCENASCKGGREKRKTLGAIPQTPFFFQYFFNQPSANVTK